MTPADLDSDSDYPSEEDLQRLRDWPPTDVSGALDFARSIWHWEDRAGEVLRPEEVVILGAEPGDRFARFATGGWSGNEDIIDAVDDNRMIRAFTWRLSARGGLHIYEYPKAGK